MITCMSLSECCSQLIKVQFHKRAIVRSVMNSVVVNMQSFSDTRKITLAFATYSAGALAPKRFYQSHPNKISIHLLQGCFIDLDIDYFFIYVKVKFSVDGEWEQLRIPFAALMSFQDAETMICEEFKIIPDIFMEQVLADSNLLYFSKAHA